MSRRHCGPVAAGGDVAQRDAGQGWQRSRRCLVRCDDAPTWKDDSRMVNDGWAARLGHHLTANPSSSLPAALLYQTAASMQPTTEDRPAGENILRPA